MRASAFGSSLSFTSSGPQSFNLRDVLVGLEPFAFRGFMGVQPAGQSKAAISGFDSLRAFGNSCAAVRSRYARSWSSSQSSAGSLASCGGLPSTAARYFLLLVSASLNCWIKSLSGCSQFTVSKSEEDRTTEAPYKGRSRISAVVSFKDNFKLLVDESLHLQRTMKS